MLKMSPFLSFLLYCLFVSFTVYYLTKDKLDEKSRYMLIAVLILPYIFMDQISNFTNVESNLKERETFEPILPPKQFENFNNIIEQPKIELKESEKVENLKILEEIKKKELQKEQKSSEKTFTLEEVQKLLNSVNQDKEKPIVENFGSAYNGNVKNEYNDAPSFTNQAYKPLGENGNGLTNAWDHDYILLNTDKWGPSLNPPPVCKTEKACPVCPNMSSAKSTMLRDFNSNCKITPPIKADLNAMNGIPSSTPSSM